MTRVELGNIVQEIIFKLQNLTSNIDTATKAEIFNAFYEKTGIKDYTEFNIILEVVKALSIDTAERVLTPKCNEKEYSLSDMSYKDVISKEGLDTYNVMNCLFALSLKQIPVLVGSAGCGKTYTAEHLAEIIYKFKNVEFDSVVQTKINCSGIAHNSFWGSFDAVSHTCVGLFKYIYRQAEENTNKLYYVILDELLDISDIRRTFGESFADLTNLPNNLVIVGTGNNDIWDKGNAVQLEMLNDRGILGRFKLIDVHNIIEDLDSDEAKRYLSKFDNYDYAFRFAYYWARNKSDTMMLVPRNLENFINGVGAIGVDEFKSLVKSMSSSEVDSLLLTKKPKAKDSDEISDFPEEFGYES